jgi:hypothetical protein
LKVEQRDSINLADYSVESQKVKSCERFSSDPR